MYGERALHPLSVSESQLMERKVDVGWVLAPTEYVERPSRESWDRGLVQQSPESRVQTNSSPAGGDLKEAGDAPRRRKR